MVGKGADTVISLVHHYFENHNIGEKHLIIHADNCAGQNKNNAMIKYLTWRVMTGLHTTITYSFMVAGHTKFSPDGFFGLFKLKLRNSEVDDLEDLAQVVRDSTLYNYNIPQLIVENGKRKVKFFNWTLFLNNYFDIVPQILKQHHFYFSNNNIGYVFIKTAINEPEQKINLVKNNQNLPPMYSFPTQKFSLGLSATRQWYLYEEIRAHIQNPLKKDNFCSLPLVSKSKNTIK